MPKEPSSRKPGAPGYATEARRNRAQRVREAALEMPFRCKRCDEKNLRCFVDTATGRCAGCISVHAECSLFVPEAEWEKVEEEKRAKRLALSRAKAEAARLRVELLEVEDRLTAEHSLARRN
ncbi:hypothetical protein BDW02DRAFT_570075 [Decorospora gaudefroyi]|uniref:Uncharacterized protein n=1 Tax=Decorospora gaudefroyi TaxID=184978 RepID=A0A6A5K6P1_9PLEO|nr:hypothetical protein BDW02DRAFT_570075 [Decorospora gaudefroyi]